MRKLIILSGLLLSSLNACQEKQPSLASTKIQKKQNGKMLDIYQQVTITNQKPWYEVEFSQEACGYEILINGLPLYRYLLFGSINEQIISINEHLLNSGKQEIVIRLFPPQLSDKSWSPTLVDASKFKIKVIHHDTDSSKANSKQVFEFNTTNKNGTENFIGSGQKVFEFKGSFNAEIPYQLPGWKNSKDLSKENQDKLLQEAVAAYNSFRNVLINKDTGAYASLMYDKEVEIAKACYWDTSEDSKKRWEELSAAVREKRQILPIKDFKMVLYAGGKVLALQPTDELYKDYLSAIHAQTDSEDIQVSFLLHKKAGSNQLTPIR